MIRLFAFSSLVVATTASADPVQMEGPYDRAGLEQRLTRGATGARQRATINLVTAPFVAAYVTDVPFADGTHQELVVSLANDALFVRHLDTATSTDHLGGLLLRGETGHAQIIVSLYEGGCRHALWIGVGASGKPSVIEGAKDCVTRARSAFDAPTKLRFL